MEDIGVIDRFYNVFSQYIDSGFGLLGGEVQFLTAILVAIDITLAGLLWAWGDSAGIFAKFIRKVLYIGAFAFIITNFAWRQGEPDVHKARFDARQLLRMRERLSGDADLGADRAISSNQSREAHAVERR